MSDGAVSRDVYSTRHPAGMQMPRQFLISTSPRIHLPHDHNTSSPQPLQTPGAAAAANAKLKLFFYSCTSMLSVCAGGKSVFFCSLCRQQNKQSPCALPCSLYLHWGLSTCRYQQELAPRDREKLLKMSSGKQFSSERQ